MLQYEIDTPLYELIAMIGEKGAVESYDACSKSIDQLGEVCKQIKSKAGFKKKDSLYFAALKKDVNGLKNEFEARKNVGFDVSWLTSGEIQKAYNIERTYGGILSKQGASVDAFMLVHELLEFNRKRGLKTFDKPELKDVEYGDHINEVILNTGA